MNQPWLKFYPTDWQADASVRMCSLAARGLWIEMLCLMHVASPRGSLLVNGRQVSPKQLAPLVGISAKEAVELIQELEDAGVFSRDEDGTIFSRRMRRDDKKAEQDKANGKAGGNPLYKGKVKPGVDKGVNPPDNPYPDPDPDWDGGGVNPKRGDSRVGARAIATQNPEARNQKDTSLRSVARARPPDANGQSHPAAKTGSRVPPDWQPSPEDRVFAESEGLNGAQLSRTVGSFRDYWLAKPGADGRKADWSATWRNWIRRETSRPAGQSGPQERPTRGVHSALAGIEAFSRNES